MADELLPPEPDYEAMSMEELQAEFVSLAKQLVPIANRRNKVHALMEKRKAEVSVRARIGNLREHERDALREVLKKEKQP